jgi:hypothetical protein
MNPCFAVHHGGEQNGKKNKEVDIMCSGNKTAESMKNNVSEEEKKKMWERVAECCCSEMTDEQKQKWMKDMPQMIQHLKECEGPMMGMMMGRMHGKGEEFMPWDMCKEMMSSIRHSQRIATLATPEVQGLFEDWVEQIEEEMLDYLKDKDPADIKGLAAHFKISKESAYYFLTRLAQKGKVTLNVKKDKS